MRPSRWARPCNGGDDITPSRAALRDFDPAEVRSGSIATVGGAGPLLLIPRERRYGGHGRTYVVAPQTGSCTQHCQSLDPATVRHVYLFRALQKHFPGTVATLEGPLEPILDEFPDEGLPTDCGSNRAIFPNCSVDVLRIRVHFSLACHYRAKHRQRNNRWPATPLGCCRRTSPLSIIWTSSTGIVELR